MTGQKVLSSGEIQHEFADETSQRIVVAAADLFISHGFDNTSTADIARASSVTKREIYDRFASKDELLEQVMKLAYGPINEPRMRDGDGLADTLSRIGIETVQQLSSLTSNKLLKAVLGAARQYPNAPKIFWHYGPGQHIEALAFILHQSPETDFNNIQTARSIARQFIIDCCGPFILSTMIDASQVRSNAELKSYIEKVSQNLMDSFAN